MNVIDNKITASPDMVIVHKETGAIMGAILHLGKYDSPENYIEKEVVSSQ